MNEENRGGILGPFLVLVLLTGALLFFGTSYSFQAMFWFVGELAIFGLLFLGPAPQRGDRQHLRLAALEQPGAVRPRRDGHVAVEVHGRP